MCILNTIRVRIGETERSSFSSACRTRLVLAGIVILVASHALACSDESQRKNDGSETPLPTEAECQAALKSFDLALSNMLMESPECKHAAKQIEIIEMYQDAYRATIESLGQGNDKEYGPLGRPTSVYDIVMGDAILRNADQAADMAGERFKQQELARATPSLKPIVDFCRKHAVIRAWASLTNDQRNAIAHSRALKDEVIGMLLQHYPIRDASSTFKNSLIMEFVRVPSGTFTLNEASARADKEFDVTLASFYLGADPVSQEQYRLVMNSNPSAFTKTGTFGKLVVGQDTDALPVDSVTWNEAKEFCRRLSNLPPERRAKRVYRLPTEAEWEFAARNGSDAWGAWGASYPHDSGDHPVQPQDGAPITQFQQPPPAIGELESCRYGIRALGGKPDKALGEWCADAFVDLGVLATGNGVPPSSDNSHHVIRGGIFWERPDADTHFMIGSDCNRGSAHPDWRAASFRVVCEIVE